MSEDRPAPDTSGPGHERTDGEPVSEPAAPGARPRGDDRADRADQNDTDSRAASAGPSAPAGPASAGQTAASAPSASAGPSATDEDAWAAAAAEDLEAEQARRRTRYGPPPGSAAEELRKLLDAVTDRLSDLPSPLLQAVAGPAAQQVVRQVVRQAKAVVEPVVERNPEVFDHLAAAGGELLAAYRSAVQAQERRWTTGDSAPAGTHGREDHADRGEDRADDRGEHREDGDGPGGGPAHHIDLD